MKTSSRDTTSLPAQQQALRAKCFHPTGTFIEFNKEEIGQSIPDRFENQVCKHPHRMAIKTKDNELTYSELNKAANRIAHAILAGRGERQEQVALLFRQGAAAIAATLGVLKAGKRYVPLDPAVPNARNSYIIGDSQIGLVVTNNETISLAYDLAQNDFPLMNIDSLDPGISTDNPGLHISPDRPSYIMYTSGSTGQPKGVMQNHKNVLYKTMGWVNLVHICPEDRLSLFRSLSVSGSIRDLFGGLLSGAAVLPFDVKKEGLRHLAGWLVNEEITIYNSVVTLFRHFGDTLAGGENFSSVRLIKLSGEPVYKRDVEVYKKYFSQDCLLINMLASAEVGTTQVYFMDKETSIYDNVVPIGYPLEGCEVLLLDDNGNRLGVNQIGEVAVQSRYLSPGYWRRPDLTEASFLPAPEGGNERIYRTGDLGRLLPDGCLVHLGRKDFHVKIRGYSVEIAEIEAALIDLDTVKEAVVTTKENAQGDQVLVAYVVPTGQRALTISTIRKSLTAKLPDYMVPSAFIFLDTLPLTGPGKVNLQALPKPGSVRPDLETPFALPRTPVEDEIAKIWAEVLSLDQVGIHDSFIELGGHSLAATQLVSRVINTFQIELPLRSWFDAPTVAEMAAVITKNQAKKAGREELSRMLIELEALSNMLIRLAPNTPRGSVRRMARRAGTNRQRTTSCIVRSKPNKHIIE